ncbi:acyltransferase family protein [Pseudoroseicyclus tamaricis]|uniref:Acyltransferase n=1 Tax=Pseudoroseicyclus tamaricis TaxID=2705421 RepID=A0A6B2JVQ6_9RHOB|nr:acyltransferase family protein [Pseudoroseicyclus tamaricis]NDU99481.1 acyltransferase [Pseudoroseicyclus tamaricis]
MRRAPRRWRGRGRTIDAQAYTTGTGPRLTYRPAIDGLRAVAVVAVILYHFSLGPFGGGFTGVDVFFVISGFLIGGLLFKEMEETGRLRLGRFYLRRIRRLAPAFFLMAGVTTLAAAAILLPWELREYGKSLIAASIWVSNIQFWREAGYFDAAAEMKPLLHTWSLSVEEQFYLLLPVALLALGLIRRAMVPVLALLWAVSLAACLWVTPSAPDAAFYLFPFRAWELLTGVLLARLALGRPAPGGAGGALAGAAGLATVVAGIFLLRPEGFPGWQAIVPVAGTALLLWQAGGGGPVNRLLASPPARMIGRLSYSLYLWHWPVLTLSLYWRGAYEGWWEALLWLALAAALSVLSWALVEEPVRHGRFGGRARPMLAGAGGALAAALLAGLVFWQTDGLPKRYGPEARGYIAAAGGFLQDWSRCETARSGPLTGLETCAIGPEGDPEVLIWGDSHLRALMDGLGLAALESGTPGLIVWHAGCPPLFGLSKVESAATPAEDAACLRDTEVMRAALPQLPALGIERLLLVGRWTYYAQGTGIGIDAGNTIALHPAPGSPLPEAPQAELYAGAWALTEEEIRRSIPELHVLRQVPEIPDFDSRELARLIAHRKIGAGALAQRSVAPSEQLAARVRDAEAPVWALANAGQIHLIDPWPALCPEVCSAQIGGVPVYHDNNHLTNRGALELRGLFLPFLTGAE